MTNNVGLMENRCRVKAVGELDSITSMGSVSGTLSIGGIPLEDSSFLVTPLSVRMSVPLILGMDF